MTDIPVLAAPITAQLPLIAHQRPDVYLPVRSATRLGVSEERFWGSPLYGVFEMVSKV